MDNSKNKIYNSYNIVALEALYLKYKVSKYYIRQCISGNVNGPKADGIKKDYETMERAVEKIVAEFINENNIKTIYCK